MNEAPVGPRGAPTVEVTYRSPGAFLVAYITQLAKGELFIESRALPPIGMGLSLRLVVAPSVVVLDSAVAWTREEAPGLPGGMNVTLSAGADALGIVVDQVASSFGGFRVLLGTAEAAPRAILTRYLRSILACKIIEADDPSERGADAGALDLAVIDLDSSGPRGFELGGRLRQRSRPAPMLALAQLERDRVKALRVGFDEALLNPPAFADLQAAVVRCLSRATTTHQSTKFGTLKGYSND
jgi:CheY-like chemotaxis protein